MDRVPILERLERAAGSNTELFNVFRGLPIDLVGDILLGIPDRYPRAAAARAACCPISSKAAQPITAEAKAAAALPDPSVLR